MVLQVIALLLQVFRNLEYY